MFSMKGAGSEELAANSGAPGLLTGRFRVRESNLKEEMQVLQSDRRAGWPGGPEGTENFIL